MACGIPVTNISLLEVKTLVKLLLVMPAINDTPERFSALCRLKNYLRTTMSQQRLNHVMLLHVHKEKVDSLSRWTRR